MKKTLIAGAMYALPFIALAQTTLITAVDTVSDIISFIVPLVGALLLVFFFVGVVGYVNAGGDEEGRTAARNKMIYSVIGMFVAFSIFGLVKLVGRTFGVQQGERGNLPGIDLRGTPFTP